MQIEHATLAAVLHARAGETDVGALLAAVRAVGGPREDGEGSRADLAFGAVVLLEHLDVGIRGQAVLADRWEIGRLPARPVQVLLDLGWHDDGGGVFVAVVGRANLEGDGE